jgi:hypothetical protein
MVIEGLRVRAALLACLLGEGDVNEGVLFALRGGESDWGFGHILGRSLG